MTVVVIWKFCQVISQILSKSHFGAGIEIVIFYEMFICITKINSNDYVWK